MGKFTVISKVQASKIGMAIIGNILILLRPIYPSSAGSSGQNKGVFL
jgi:hypothetical protein